MHEATEAVNTTQLIIANHTLALIPLLPLIGALINGTMGWRLQRRFGRLAVGAIGLAMPWTSFVLAVAAFISLAQQPSGSILLHSVGNWFTVGVLKVNLAYSLDPLSGMMVLIVTFIGSLIHVYSLGYMRDDEAFWRFFTYLNLFMFAMLTLVLADNFLLMFVGWEGVGLCSYLLIGFWYKDLANARAGMKAFIVNRVGDFGFLIGLMILFWGVGGTFYNGHYFPGAAETFSLTFRELPALVGLASDKLIWGMPILTLAAVFFFVGATGKSAQIPLYVWLPDAMAGPTPVSALIHAATMVTAGVYMVARMNFLYVHSPAAMTVVALIGAATALFAATIGCFQHDIKKVLAYSTVSQLGYMFIGVGVGAYWAGAYHLLTHAFFKACLFLGAGSVILAMHHEQDMRKMGGLGRVMPLTRLTYWVSCVAISGFPIAAGFYSKDEILWQAFNSKALLVPGYVPWAIGLVAAGLTSFYMWRSYFLTFTGPLAVLSGHGHGHDDALAAHGSDAHAAARAGDSHGASAHGGDAHAAARVGDPHGAPALDAAALVASGAAHDHSAASDHGGHGGHGHGHGQPEEQKPVVTWVLLVLAAGAVLTSLLGLPVLWTGHAPVLEHFLSSVFVAAEDLPKVFPHGEGHWAEWLLMVVSVGVASLGLSVSWWLYRGRTSDVPARLLALFPRVHDWVYHKYYVDEGYQKTVVFAFMGTSTISDWLDRNLIDRAVNLVGALMRVVSAIDGFIDAQFVDGAVNLVARIVHRGGVAARQLQTGRLTSYLAGATVGALLLVVVARFVLDIVH